jgi:serine/threonine protein kinase
MGAVYVVVDPSIGRRFALKVLRRAAADDAAVAARLEREARATADIRHPGIVEILAFGRLPDGRPYLVMPRSRARRCARSSTRGSVYRLLSRGDVIDIPANAPP